MPPKSTPLLLFYTILGPDVGLVTSVKILLSEGVSELVIAIKEREPTFGNVPARVIGIWKLSNPFSREEIERTFDPGTMPRTGKFPEAQLLDPLQKLSSYFPERPVDAKLHIVVYVPESYADMRKKRKLEGETTASDDAGIALAGPTPSSAARMPAFQREQRERPVLNGRPSNNFGPPIGNFHPAFDSFFATMKSSERLPIGPDKYSLVRTLFNVFADIYTDKKQRMESIREVLRGIIGRSFISESVPGVEADSVIVNPCGNCKAYSLVLEGKNEIGAGSADPCNQACLSYRKYWAQTSQHELRARSYCPSILLAVAGPWLCVAGGVYLANAVMQPSTGYVWLGGDAFAEDGQLRYVTRLFSAMTSAIDMIEESYDSLHRGYTKSRGFWVNPLEKLDPGPFPFVQKFAGKTFTYLSSMAPHPNKNRLLYKARLSNSGQPVVVKFVLTYNAQAHRLLAAQKLVPHLHHISTEMYGGRHMVVMDFVDGEPRVPSLSRSQFEQVDQAAKLLHLHDLVLGDLRLPNILIDKQYKNAMIIDFDWCGKEGEAYYPTNLNLDEITWVEGVQPDSVMMKSHDLFMLAQLEPPRGDRVL